MKTLITIAFLSFITVTTSAVGTNVDQTANASVSTTLDNGFKYFRVHRQAAGVAMSWASSSPDVAQFVVERSYDGEYFEEVSNVPSNGNGMHKYNDQDVFPGIIYYRIKAIKENGSEEYSVVETVRIVRRG